MRLFSGIVHNYTNGITISTYWIGANLLMAPRWTWTTNDTALYTNWGADQPSDPSSFQCASVRTDGTNLWRKQLCSSAQPFVCTADPIAPPTTPPPSKNSRETYHIYLQAILLVIQITLSMKSSVSK